MSRYRSSGILVDTGLLLVLYVGLYDPQQVERFRRTRQSFSRKDFEYILSFVDQFERVVTTPHILTEVSNFLGQLHGKVRDGCFATFSQHVASATTHEHLTPARALAGAAEFVPLGITDTSIIEAAAESHLVLTTDYRLHGRLISKGIDALNYNHFRPL